MLVHDSGAARGDDVMAPMTNLRILYRMYDAPKSIITLTVRVSLTSRVTIKTGQKCVPSRPWRIMLKNVVIMLCSNALKCFDYASKNCYYACIMLAYNIFHERVARVV